MACRKRCPSSVSCSLNSTWFCFHNLNAVILSSHMSSCLLDVSVNLNMSSSFSDGAMHIVLAMRRPLRSILEPQHVALTFQSISHREECGQTRCPSTRRWKRDTRPDLPSHVPVETAYPQPEGKDCHDKFRDSASPPFRSYVSASTIDRSPQDSSLDSQTIHSLQSHVSKSRTFF